MVLYTASLKYINKNIQLVSRKMWEIIDYVLSCSPDPTMNSETIVSFIPFFVFGFWSLLATKLRKYENISNLFYILQGNMGKTEKKGKKITQLTKIPKTNRRKYGMNET